jgi:sterol desaturase/sphingolipid hydroxylase (fatty acid hydroxylase superfamily)
MNFLIDPLSDQTTPAFVSLMAIAGMFVACAVLELLWPARRGAQIANNRMTANFGLGIGNMLLGSLLPLSSLTAAAFAEAQGWGVFNRWPIDWWAELPLLCLGVSALTYGMHWTFHHVDWMWSLHAVHHHDQNVDLSTTFRTHPAAYLIMLAANCLFMLAMGPTMWILIAVEVLILVGGLAEHSNVRVPDRWCNKLEWLFVTPRMHLVHHARDRRLHDSNYGTLFSIWDHLFGTYRRQPKANFTLGVPRNEGRMDDGTLPSV